MDKTASCPNCQATLHANLLELSFICPGCGSRVPPATMWGLTDALDDRILNTDASFQAFQRGWNETSELQDENQRD